MSVRQAARELGLAASTIHRWLNDGFIAGMQLTPGAPWRIRVNDALKRRLVQDAPEGYVVMQEATKHLGDPVVQLNCSGSISGCSPRLSWLREAVETIRSSLCRAQLASSGKAPHQRGK